MQADPTISPETNGCWTPKTNPCYFYKINYKIASGKPSCVTNHLHA